MCGQQALELCFPISTAGHMAQKNKGLAAASLHLAQPARGIFGDPDLNQASRSGLDKIDPLG
jgi:hypothetical protein